MAQSSPIEWTDMTWNPVRGCSRVSEGCRHCYAEKVAARFNGPGQAYEGLATSRGWTGKVRLIEKHLADPLRIKKPKRIFVNSMSDLFHESLSFEDIDLIFGVMALATQHAFQILTKRPQRAVEYFRSFDNSPAAMARGENFAEAFGSVIGDFNKWFDGCDRVAESRFWRGLPNVWLGVSVENQAVADERIPLLLQIPAVVRFLSVEPLLGDVDISRWVAALSICKSCNDEHEGYVPGPCPSCGTDSLITTWGDDQAERLRSGDRYLTPAGEDDQRNGPSIHWVIVGGESGPNARPCNVVWIRSIIEQCKAASVPAFVKQLGAKPYAQCVDCGRAIGGHVQGGFVDACGDAHARLISDFIKIRHSKGGDWNEWPMDLRIREFPREVRP